HEVVVTEDGAATSAFAPYDIFFDAIGGPTLANGIAMLAPRGVAVTYGITGSTEATIDVARFYRGGNLTLHGFQIFPSLGIEPASVALRRLASMLEHGTLRAHVEVEAPWTAIGRVAQDLWDRRFSGKAVLHVE
ncbi:MAG: NADPH:quinone reductase, partial [Chloroflexota bacterium]|nr:NADPH:quinone reductase [Chloroflexota bacterium]